MSTGAPSSGQGSVPQGIEQLLILSGLNAAWKGKVLADPLAAAREAQIDLSASEQAILKALPRTSLARMAASFQNRNTLKPAARFAGAAAVAAAALLAGARTHAEDVPVRVAGAMANPPAQADVDAPPIAWIATLPEALAQAAKTGRVVMAVIDKPQVPVLIAGMMSDADSSQIFACDHLRTSRDLRAAVKVLSPLSVWVQRPATVLPGSDAETKYQQSLQDYKALLTKYGIEGKLPMVLFLAPDGMLLTKVEQPKDEAQLIDTMKSVPPLLAKWVAAQQERIPPPVATRGIRASQDTPAAKDQGQ